MSLRARQRTRTAFLILTAAIALSGCAYDETNIAESARTRLVGMSELDLEACLGIPDHTVTKGKTSLFTYSSTDARTLNLSIPIVNGVGMSVSGNCHATIRLENGLVTSVAYAGDSYGFEGPDSACAPIVRGCVKPST